MRHEKGKRRIDQMALKRVWYETVMKLQEITASDKKKYKRNEKKGKDYSVSQCYGSFTVPDDRTVQMCFKCEINGQNCWHEFFHCVKAKLKRTGTSWRPKNSACCSDSGPTNVLMFVKSRPILRQVSHWDPLFVVTLRSQTWIKECFLVLAKD